MLILNFKTYPESTGENAISLMEIIANTINENPIAAPQIFAAPSLVDLVHLQHHFPMVNLIAQHVDTQAAGSSTGRIPVQTLLSAGVKYSLLNHSEHRVWNPEINNQIIQIQNLGIKLVVCCEDISEAEALLPAQPFAIALEPKELIGTGKSVSTYKAQEVVDFLALVKKSTSKAFIGAGISNAADIQAGKDLGADGYLLASALVKAQDKKTFLSELISVL